MKSYTKRFLSFILALVLSFSLCAPAFAAGGFSDVPASHWAYDDIMACAEQGIVTGMGDGKFHPGDEVTGTQFVVMLTRTFYNDQVEAARETETSSWYAPNMKVANDVGMFKNGQFTLTVNDSAMNRYDMAFVLYSILWDHGKTADMRQRTVAKNSISDAASIPTNRQFQVYNCYHFGIITGMSDGTFSGNASMTRAQACAVIVRMMNLIGSEAPAQPEQPVQPTQPEQPQQTAGKLTNGKDATVENVVAMLKEIEEKYPTGTPWGPSGTANNNWYIAPATSKTRDVVTCTNKVAPSTSLIYACGGWAAMVSETIFGQSGAPCREVYSMKDARPGDILYKVYTGTTRGYHVAIITSVVKNPDDGTYRITTCGGNVNGKVAWDWNNEYGDGAYGMQTKDGSISYRIFTRYPD